MAKDFAGACIWLHLLRMHCAVNAASDCSSHVCCSHSTCTTRTIGIGDVWHSSSQDGAWHPATLSAVCIGHCTSVHEPSMHSVPPSCAGRLSALPTPRRLWS
jgi:hypothetical protein